MKKNEKEAFERRIRELEGQVTWKTDLLAKSAELQKSSEKAYQTLAQMIHTEVSKMQGPMYTVYGNDEKPEVTLARVFGSLKTLEGRVDELQDANDNLTMLLKVSMTGKDMFPVDETRSLEVPHNPNHDFVPARNRRWRFSELKV